MKLRTMDVSRYEKWTVEAYYLAVQEGETERAVALLKDMATRSKKWREELAKFYIEIKRYQQSASEYMRLHKGASSPQEKKKYLLKALQALQYGSFLDEATRLARQYEALYYKDSEMSGMFIRLYLSAGALDDAKRVSIERLKYRE